MANTFIHWNDLRGKAINVNGQGRQIGLIENFYYEPSTNSINALRVNAGLKGYRILLSSAIASLSRDGATIANEHMLIDEANAGPVYQFPLGDSLIGNPVSTEKGEDLGTIRDVLLGISPPVALHILAFELTGGTRQRVSANEIASFGEATVIVMR
jgi:uncharacterized protein YrrD